MRVSEAELGVEVISLKTFLSVYGVVATGTVRAVYPDLRERNICNFQRKSSLASGVVSICVCAVVNLS